jgi:hypothetical protein
MRELTPTSWNELNDALWERSFDNNCDKWRSYTAFRGLSQRYGNLKTSLQRLDGDIRWKERRLIDSFRLYARKHLRHGITDWHVLLIGQHYRLPTRLLDWTSSPLAALFFAAEDHPDKDGEIWCVQRLETNTALSPVMTELKEKQGTNLFNIETLSKAFPCISDFDAAEAELPCPSLLFFEPPSISPRIINQYAYFSVIPSATFDTAVWLEAHLDWCWKIVVPTGLKKEIRERLLVMNISERTIYPGLDGISRWLRAWYA